MKREKRLLNRSVAAGEDGLALTELERAFIDEYLRTFDLVAVMKAIKPMAGWSPFEIQRKGREILLRPQVAAEVTARLEANIISRAEVLYRLTDQARGAYATYLNDDGTVDLATMLADGKGHLIRVIRPGRYGNTVEFMDGQKALEMMAKHYKLLTEKVEVDGSVSITVTYDDIEPSQDELED